MSRVDAHQIMAAALRELADASRAQAAFARDGGKYDDSEARPVYGRLRDAEERCLEVALGLFPPSTPRRKT